MSAWALVCGVEVQASRGDQGAPTKDGVGAVQVGGRSHHDAEVGGVGVVAHVGLHTHTHTRAGGNLLSSVPQLVPARSRHAAACY